jgi:hypothetical protein
MAVLKNRLDSNPDDHNSKKLRYGLRARRRNAATTEGSGDSLRSE